MTTVTFDPAEQQRRRRRARVSQVELARHLNIAPSKVSEYETQGKPLPWKLTADDYESALAAAIKAKRQGGAK